MAHYPSFIDRVGWNWVCVADASILCDDPCLPEDNGEAPHSLRQEASRDGICFLQIVRALPNGGGYMARVAAVPERLADEEQSYVAYFTEEDLFAALPFDCRMRKRPSEILAILRAHAARIRPLAPTEPAPGQRLHPASELPLEPLRHLETVATVVTTDLQQELGAEARCEAKQQVAYEQAVQQSVGRGVYKRQTLLLQQLIEQQPPVSVPSARSFQIAALRALGRRLPLWLLQARFRNAAAYRALQKAKSYLPRLMDYIRRTGQRLLNLVPQRGRRRGEVQWHVTIGIPDHLLTRA